MRIVKCKNSPRKRFNKLLKSARERSITVDLNEYWYSNLLKTGCVYCGKDLLKENGYCIDRADNNKGYTFENSVPCCKHCNMAKGTQTQDEFFDYIKKAYKHQKKCLDFFSDTVLNEKDTLKENNIIKNKSGWKNSKKFFSKGKR